MGPTNPWELAVSLVFLGILTGCVVAARLVTSLFRGLPYHIYSNALQASPSQAEVRAALDQIAGVLSSFQLEAAATHGHGALRD